MTEKQISVRISATGGDKLQAQLKGIGTQGARAFQQVGASAGANRANLQNAAYQIQDVFVQVASGTDVSRALAQQLPQLLGSMGLIGVIAGTAAAALIPLGAAMFGTKDGAEEAASAIDDFAKSVEDLSKFNEVYSTDGIQAQIEKYGELNAEVLLLIQRTRELKTEQAMADAEAAVAAIGESLGDLRGQLTAYDNLMANVGDNPSLAADAAVWAESIQEQYGLTIEKAKELINTMESIGSATSTEAAASAMSDLAGQIEGTSLETVALRQDLIAAEGTLRELANAAPSGGWMNAAIGGVTSLIGTLWEAVGAANALAREQALVATQQRGEAYVENATLIGAYQLYGDTRNAAPDEPVKPPAVKKGGGGGGGQSDALKEHNELMREAERVIEDTRTAQEKYNIEVGKLDTLLSKNLISQEVYDRALQDIRDSLKETTDVAGILEDGISDVASGLIEAAANGESFGDALGSAIRNVAIQLAESQLNAALLQIAQALFPNLMGSTTPVNVGAAAPAAPSFAGGGYTGNGARSGGLDGKGGFMAMLHPRETVTDHTMSGRGGGGKISVHFHGGNLEEKDVDVQQRQGANGEYQLHIMLKKKVGELVQGGELDSVFNTSFGLKRKGR